MKKNIIDRIIEAEGGYTDDKSDSGKETNFGITVAVARDFGYSGDMKEMERDVAEIIYQKKYWDVLRLDAIHDKSAAIAEELMDTGVNQGISRAAKFLQRSLNALNKEEAAYPDLTVDGIIGQNTIRCLNSYLDLRARDGEKVLLRCLNCLQGAFYIGLTERREKDEKFLFGWMLRRIT